MVIEVLALCALAYAVRVLPQFLAPRGGGVDQWFWKAYIEKLRATSEFPPRLPQFVLDEAQWYPPLFPVLLARLPAAVFERHAHQLAVLIDLARLLLVVAATRWITGSDPAALVAGAVYTFTPLLVTYNMQLNPRGLGALFLDGAWLAAGAVIFGGASDWLWLVAALLGGLVLLTHKMTTQVFCFVALTLPLASGEWRFALLIPASIFFALLCSKGFYARVAQAHWDIVTFWNRNWKWLGSNPVLESPIYGERGFQTPTKYYRSGWRGALRRLQFLAGFNPWVWSALALAAYQFIYGPPFAAAETATLCWLLLSFGFSLLTTEVPAMRCLGNGYLYGYNAAFPAALFVGVSFNAHGVSPVWSSVATATLLLSFLALGSFFRAMSRSKTLKVETGLDDAISRLRELPRGVVMCLPAQWSDIVAYRSGQSVLFGGHGYGFRRLELFFPRLLVAVRDLIRDNGVLYFLTHDGYVNQKFLADLPDAVVEEFGQYRLYRFEERLDAIPVGA